MNTRNAQPPSIEAKVREANERGLGFSFFFFSNEFDAMLFRSCWECWYLIWHGIGMIFCGPWSVFRSPWAGSEPIMIYSIDRKSDPRSTSTVVSPVACCSGIKRKRGGGVVFSSLSSLSESLRFQLQLQLHIRISDSSRVLPLLVSAPPPTPPHPSP